MFRSSVTSGAPTDMQSRSIASMSREAFFSMALSTSSSDHQTGALLQRAYAAWSDVFGESNCIVRLYEPVKADIVSDFVENVLGIGDIAQFASMNRRANERVSRDVLEFKRQKWNGKATRERYGAYDPPAPRRRNGIRKSEPDYYQEFLSPDERAELLRRVDARNGGSTGIAWLTAVPAVRSRRREGSLEALSGA